MTLIIEYEQALMIDNVCRFLDLNVRAYRHLVP